MKLLFLVYILTVCCAHDAYAQIERVLPRKNQSSFEDTRFVVGFMQNDVFIPGFYEPPDEGLVLQVFIASDYNATVTIDLPNGSRFVRNVQANTVYTETLDPHLMMHVSERPMRQSVFITSDVPVVVYAINTLAASTDTYIALPMKHLGTEYRAVTRSNDFYPSLGSASPDQRLVDSTMRQAEFMVMAVEDNTMVQYTPSYATEGGVAAGQQANVVLQRGECFLVKSVVEVRGRGDLTGSLVTSSRPVAFLSGHSRVSIPLSSTNRFSKDHLVEMLPPTSLWGVEHATVPFGSGIVSGDYIRIVAAQDNTTLTRSSAIGATTVALARAGDWVEFPDVRFPTRWVSDKPTMVAQFMVTQSYAGTSFADPAMVIVPPVQYYATRALFQFPRMQIQSNAPRPQPFYYFVNVLCEDTGLSSFRINGIPVQSIEPAISSQIIPGTNLHWAQLTLNSGVFVLEVDSGTFSGVMYATTYVDSYANMFGASFEPRKRMDVSPPLFMLTNECWKIRGLISDTVKDAGFKRDLKEVVVQRDRTTNYTWQVNGPIDTSGTMEFDASVSDPWKDARIVIEAWDTQGNGKEWLFTYHAPKVQVAASIQFQGGTGQVCSTLVVKNTDTVELILPSIRLVGDKRYAFASPVLDTVRVRPGDSLSLDVCFTMDGSKQPAYGTIFIDLPCGLKKEVRLTMTVLASIATTNLDFGAVRIGDTLCKPVAVINDGTVDVTIDSVALVKAFPEFVPNVVGLRLPRTLRPRDTLWIDVCFVPVVETISMRVDTVHGTPLVQGSVQYRGRGIRPRVADVVIDWKKRRVGTNHDTSFVLRNSGEASCVLNAISWSGDTSQFTAPGLLASVASAGLQISSIGTISSPASFLPTGEGVWRSASNVLVDWRFHDTVHVVFIGEGILPVIRTQDLDLGTIRLDERKDSVCRIYAAGGSEALTVDGAVLAGPNATAFTVAADVFYARLLAVGDSLLGNIGFVPQRTGRHDAWIDITHDAAPGFVRRVARVRITANVVGVDTTRVEAIVGADPDLVACTDVPAFATFRNTGNTTVVVNDVLFTLDNGAVRGDTITYPVMVPPAAELQVSVVGIADKFSNGVLNVTFRYNDTMTVTSKHVFNVITPVAMIDLPAGITSAPGSTEVVRISVEVRDSLSQPISVHVNVYADNERFALPLTVVSADVLEGGRQGSVDMLVSSVGSTYSFVATRPIETPFVVSWSVPFSIMWKDASISAVRGEVLGTMCSSSDVDSTVFGVSLCGSNLRAIRFGAIAMIDVSVAPMPARTQLELRCTSNADEVVQVDVIDPSGTRITIGQNLSLKKGTQYLKFPCSGFATGWYQVVVVGMSGSLVVPVIIVN